MVWLITFLILAWNLPYFGKFYHFMDTGLLLFAIRSLKMALYACVTIDFAEWCKFMQMFIAVVKIIFIDWLWQTIEFIVIWCIFKKSNSFICVYFYFFQINALDIIIVHVWVHCVIHLVIFVLIKWNFFQTDINMQSSFSILYIVGCFYFSFNIDVFNCV